MGPHQVKAMAMPYQNCKAKDIWEIILMLLISTAALFVPNLEACYSE